MYIGLDGCKTGWILTKVLSDDISIQHIDNLIELHQPEYADFKIALIDVPIGFAKSTYRTCDLEARKLLGYKRANSVFFSPTREAVFVAEGMNFADREDFKLRFDEACRINKLLTGKKISMQAFCICYKIIEAEKFLADSGSSIKDKIVESHPEVCFYGFSKTPCVHSKKKKEGEQERLVIIEKIKPGTSRKIRAFMESIRTNKTIDANLDDTIDSVILALTAAQHPNLETIPDVVNPNNDGDHGIIKYFKAG